MTRPIHDYEFQNVIEMTQQYIEEGDERFNNLDKKIKGKDFESLGNAVFGSITMIYLCKYCLIVMDVKAMEGPSPDLFIRSNKIKELCKGFEDRYQKALKNYKKLAPAEVGQKKSEEQLKNIHRLASENFGSNKFDLDIDIDYK
jgi:hypothetical protein